MCKVSYGWHIVTTTMEITSKNQFYNYSLLNDFSKALDVYSDLIKKPNFDISIHTNKSCCLYALGRYKEAFEEAKKGSNSELNVI
jgi:hypothetical protein